MKYDHSRIAWYPSQPAAEGSSQLRGANELFSSGAGLVLVWFYLVSDQLSVLEIFGVTPE